MFCQYTHLWMYVVPAADLWSLGEYATEHLHSPVTKAGE